MKTEFVTQPASDSNLLRNTLRGNALFSSVSGLVFTVAARPIAGFMGLDYPAALIVIGLGLLPFAYAVFRLSRQPQIDPRAARLVIGLDLAWIVGSAAILLAGWPPLSTAGQWLVVLLADAVAIFAVGQWIGLRRLVNSFNN